MNATTAQTGSATVSADAPFTLTWNGAFVDGSFTDVRKVVEHFADEKVAFARAMDLYRNRRPALLDTSRLVATNAVPEVLLPAGTPMPDHDNLFRSGFVSINDETIVPVPFAAEFYGI